MRTIDVNLNKRQTIENWKRAYYAALFVFGNGAMLLTAVWATLKAVDGLRLLWSLTQ